MPIILTPITRRQFVKGSLDLGGTGMMTHCALAAAADSERVGVDQNRVALLADTHISADLNLVCPGTKWPGSSADLELHCINRKHKQQGDRRQIGLKDKKK